MKYSRGQRAENPRWTERWRGVLRHVPQRTVQRPPCVPLALAGYGCELRSCTSTARRPYGIPTRTVWYCIGRWSQVRREEAGRGPACGAAHRRTPIKGSRHVRVRRPVSPAAGTAPGAGHPKGLLPEGPPQVPLVAHTRGSLAVVPRALRPAPQRPQPQASVVMRETTTAASRAPQPRPLARPRVIRRVGVDLVSHRSARPSVATIATATATAVAAARPATITANPAVVTAAHRIVVTRITAPLAAVRLATRRRTAAPPWCPIGIAQRVAQPLRPRTRGMHLPQRRRHRDARLPCAAVLEA